VFGTIEDRASTLHLPLHGGGREGAVCCGSVTHEHMRGKPERQLYRARAQIVRFAFEAWAKQLSRAPTPDSGALTAKRISLLF